jgi:tRNA A-37 threonylcarbamoyl transferase component Bud32
LAADLREQLQASLGEAYQLERELGGGGMSRVFVALETALGRRVVVKVLTPELAATVSIDRFRREILFAAQLQHPHIVPLLAAGDADGLPWFTMPFVTGESLRTRLVRDGELPIAETVRVLRDVASALAYAHQQGVVHRDIKPDNVLLSHGVAVVTDFGVAKALTASSGHAIHHGGLTSMGVALGTPIYMSPEQASGDAGMDHRVDIYAFGVMAYEMLTGQPPFSGRTAQAVLGAHMAALPEPVTARRPGIPHLLAMLVMRCLEKRAADRPQTAADVMTSLDMLTTPSGGTVTLPSMPSPGTGTRLAAGTRGAVRRLWPVLLGVAAAVAIVLWMRPRSGDRAEPPTAAVPAPPPAIPPADTARAALPPVDSAPPAAAAPERRAEPKAPEPRPTPRSSALLRRLRGDVAEARLRAVAAGVSAEVLASGDQSLGRADSLGRRGSDAEAAAVLSATAAMWNDAAKEARTEQERVPAPEPAPAPPPAKPPAAAAKPPAPAPPADPKPQILAVIQQYSTAIEARNVDAIKRVYPGMLPKQALDWQQFFRAVDDIDVLLDVTKLDVTGNSAEAQLSGVYNFTDPGTRRPRKENVSFVATLKSDGGRWLIQSLR